MPRLCSPAMAGFTSFLSASGGIRRDLPNGAMFPCCLNTYQSGHWYIKPGRIDSLSVDTGEIGSRITAGT